MRSATERAARRLGWVCPIIPVTPRPNCRQIFGSCVVFPEPVSPDTITTWWSRIASAISSRRADTGRSGKTTTGIAAARSASCWGVKGLWTWARSGRAPDRALRRPFAPRAGFGRAGVLLSCSPGMMRPV